MGLGLEKTFTNGYTKILSSPGIKTSLRYTDKNYVDPEKRT